MVIMYDDNRLLSVLFGEHDSNLSRIEKELGVSVSSRGNRVSIVGDSSSQLTAKAVLDDLYSQVLSGQDLNNIAVSGAIRTAEMMSISEKANNDPENYQYAIKTRRHTVFSRSPLQGSYIKAMNENELVFGLGPAGTGKTFLAVAMGVSLLLEGKVERIILSRPAVEAGERLGFLPGDIREKVDPYLRPLYDALYHMLPVDRVVRSLDSGEIEVAPLAFMRGRTLADSFIILDEAQNTTPMQMKMLLTRMGENSKMVVTGDLSQIDLPKGSSSGLKEVLSILDGMEGVEFIRFSDSDVLRHSLVTRIVKAYDARDREKSKSISKTSKLGEDRDA